MADPQLLRHFSGGLVDNRRKAPAKPTVDPGGRRAVFVTRGEEARDLRRGPGAGRRDARGHPVHGAACEQGQSIARSGTRLFTRVSASMSKAGLISLGLRNRHAAAGLRGIAAK